MAFLQIEEGILINTDSVESVEAKGRLATQIIMKSGAKHLAQIPYESFKKIVETKQQEIQAILANIDRNTSQIRGG